MRVQLSMPTISTTRAAWLPPFAVFALAALVYSLNLNRLPHPDELYQILSAESLLTTGQPHIAEGLYTRALAQSWVIAGSIRLFGHSLAAARLSSLVSIAGTAALLFAWLRRNAGPAPAWLAAAGFALSPFAVQTAQFARIYGLQTLGFFLLCLLVYTALVPRSPLAGAGLPSWRRLLLLLPAFLCFLLALHLQPTTLLGTVGLGSWAIGALALPWLIDPAVPSGRKRLAAIAFVAFLILVLTAAWATGVLHGFWHQYRAAPLFAAGTQNDFWYYHAWYALLYPSLWPLTGLLALAALATWPAPASLALAVFSSGFLLNSFAGPKNLRYLIYAQPFLFALWGMGLASLGRPVLAFVAGLAPRLATHLPLSPAWSGRLATALVGVGLLFLFIANPAWIRSITLLAGLSVPGEEASPNWPAARPALEPYLARVPVVVTTEELGTLYFLGRFDLLFQPSKLGEIERADRHEFAPDPRTGRPVIGSVPALEQVLTCYPEGLILFPERQWKREFLFPEPVRRFIQERAQPVLLPAHSGVGAYAWSHPTTEPAPDSCAALPQLAGPAGRVPGH